jgi:hypothetical protein
MSSRVAGGFMCVLSAVVTRNVLAMQQVHCLVCHVTSCDNCGVCQPEAAACCREPGLSLVTKLCIGWPTHGWFGSIRQRGLLFKQCCSCESAIAAAFQQRGFRCPACGCRSKVAFKALRYQPSTCTVVAVQQMSAPGVLCSSAKVLPGCLVLPSRCSL